MSKSANLSPFNHLDDNPRPFKTISVSMSPVAVHLVNPDEK